MSPPASGETSIRTYGPRLTLSARDLAFSGVTFTAMFQGQEVSRVPEPAWLPLLGTPLVVLSLVAFGDRCRVLLSRARK